MCVYLVCFIPTKCISDVRYVLLVNVFFFFLVQLLPKFEIGTLLTREFTPYKADESGFYRDMCLRVGKVRSPPPPPPQPPSIFCLANTWETHYCFDEINPSRRAPIFRGQRPWNLRWIFFLCRCASGSARCAYPRPPSMTPRPFGKTVTSSFRVCPEGAAICVLSLPLLAMPPQTLGKPLAACKGVLRKGRQSVPSPP